MLGIWQLVFERIRHKMSSKPQFQKDSNVLKTLHMQSNSSTKKPMVIKAYRWTGGYINRTMDDVFKNMYYTCVFAVTADFNSDWRQQVKNMNQYWDEAVKRMDHDGLMSLFTSECEELLLPAETYDIKKAYEKAANEWRIELMLGVIENIIHLYEDEIPWDATNLVYWDCELQEIIINRSICKNF